MGIDEMRTQGESIDFFWHEAFVFLFLFSFEFIATDTLQFESSVKSSLMRPITQVKSYKRRRETLCYDKKKALSTGYLWMNNG